VTDFLYLDIETIPTDNPAHIEQIAAMVKPPASMSKADTIAAWERDSKPAKIEEAVSKTSFDGAFGRICCVGWAWNDRPAVATMHTSGNEMERVTLETAFQRIADEMPRTLTPTIVGHYVAGFDIRFIWQRAFVLGVQLPTWFPRDPKPWSRDVNDTQHMWAGARDTISLDNLCKALGIQGKEGIDGSMVAGLWKRGEFAAICNYCRDDVDRVRAVHRKMLAAMGEQSVEVAA
jgi:hypothetical protein